MVNWSEVERVKRDGEDVVKESDGHTLVKIYRLRNGSRVRNSTSLNLGVDESIPKDERKYRTSWKCDDCGVEVSGAGNHVQADCE